MPGLRGAGGDGGVRMGRGLATFDVKSGYMMVSEWALLTGARVVEEMGGSRLGGGGEEVLPPSRLNARASWL